jgi:hypothetical protein
MNGMPGKRSGLEWTGGTGWVRGVPFGIHGNGLGWGVQGQVGGTASWGGGEVSDMPDGVDACFPALHHHPCSPPPRPSLGVGGEPVEGGEENACDI